ncbi:MAG: helix-turn-helix domain-containing protein [Aromatoleum sp.]|uniref:helix-turn-helix domain-containing protein n=1 Tax=Aromatoleum sp. TaxID=2307007 RepID=UPI002896231E|nr:helix-turn-helix domain-containing protein [Aromatoleum sp.]MDT3670812.1 helix-turn-helix domain-containing protein [Aromatoleum sp.]
MSEVRLDQGVPATESADAASVGEVLRRGRERRGETVADVAYALKLTARQVEAMEGDRFDLLPGPAFVRGFVRNYARYLGMDGAALLAGFDKALAAPPIELAPLSNADGVMPSGGQSRRAHVPAALVAGILLLVVVVGWFFDWFETPAGDPAGGDASVLAPQSAPVPDASDVLAPGEVPAPPAEPAAAAPAVPSEAVRGVAPPPELAAGAATGAPAAAAMPEAGAPAAPTDASHLTFRFSGESWVEVRGAGGSVLYSGVNAAGTSRTVQGKPPFGLVIGNARAVGVEYQGKAVDLTPHIRVSVARLTVQ